MKARTDGAGCREGGDRTAYISVTPRGLHPNQQLVGLITLDYRERSGEDLEKLGGWAGVDMPFWVKVAPAVGLAAKDGQSLKSDLRLSSVISRSITVGCPAVDVVCVGCTLLIIERIDVAYWYEMPVFSQLSLFRML